MQYGRYTPKEIERYRQTYVENPGLSRNKVAQHCGIKLDSLNYLIKTHGWAKQRENFKAGPALKIIQEGYKTDLVNAALSYRRMVAEEERLYERGGSGWSFVNDIECAAKRVEIARDRLRRLGVSLVDICGDSGSTVHVSNDRC